MSARGIRPILDAADALGVDVDGALRACGLEPESLRRGEARYDRETITGALSELSRRSGDLPLGLSAAKRLETGDLGIVDFLVGACGTLREAALLGAQTFRLFHDTAELTLRDDGKNASYALMPRTRRVVAPVLAEFVIATFAHLARRLSGHDLRATEVRFAHLRVPYVRELEEFFGAPVRFDAEVNEIVFPRVYLDLPLPKADPALRRTLAECADQLIGQIPAPQSPLERARRHVVDALHSGEATLEKVSSQMNLRPRTFQRVLKRHGTSFQALLDDVRCELAVHYVTTSDVSLARVAQSLGFTDASAFSRAFRRWTGVSPSQYKMRGRSDRPPPAEAPSSSPSSEDAPSDEAPSPEE